MCIYHILFIHSSTDGYLGYCHLLAAVNSSAMNIPVQIFEHLFFYSISSVPSLLSTVSCHVISLQMYFSFVKMLCWPKL